MIKVGVDIEDIERFTGKSKHFFDKIFTEGEQEYCTQKAVPQASFAARFCAKEAVVKALSGFGIKDIYYKDIEIFHDENNCPCVRLLKPTAEKLEINLSISHESHKAVAFVVIEKC